MISVIIPAFNAGPYIEKAISSILSQTYKDTEIIVVNDGSTDSTQSIVEAIASEYPQITLINVENGGVSYARNIGIDHAKGEYIAFLDADDTYYPDAFERMLNCIETHNADICATRYGSHFQNEADKVDTVVWDKMTAIKQVIADYPATYSACAKLYRRAALGDIRFPVGKRMHEDSYFVFECLLGGMILADYPITTYHYASREGSVSRSGFSDKLFDILELSEKKAELIRGHYPELAKEADNIEIKAHMAFLRNLCSTKDKKYRALEKENIAFIRLGKKAFVPDSQDDKLWFFIITHGLYGVYKWIYGIRHHIK